MYTVLRPEEIVIEKTEMHGRCDDRVEDRYTTNKEANNIERFNSLSDRTPSFSYSQRR